MAKPVLLQQSRFTACLASAAARLDRSEHWQWQRQKIICRFWMDRMAAWPPSCIMNIDFWAMRERHDVYFGLTKKSLLIHSMPIYCILFRILSVCGLFPPPCSPNMYNVQLHTSFVTAAVYCLMKLENHSDLKAFVWCFLMHQCIIHN